MTAIAYFDIVAWPTKQRMAEILQQAGLRVAVGRYSIRVLDCDNFQFCEYGGDLGDPVLIADADDVAALLEDCQLVSDALAKASVPHRIEIHDADSAESALTLQHRWPPGPTRI